MARQYDGQFWHCQANGESNWFTFDGTKLSWEAEGTIGSGSTLKLEYRVRRPDGTYSAVTDAGWSVTALPDGSNINGLAGGGKNREYRFNNAGGTSPDYRVYLFGNEGG